MTGNEKKPMGTTVSIDRSGEHSLERLLNSIRPWHFLILLASALAVRLPVFFNLDNYLVGWRPTDLASIARNYLNNGFHFLYPQIDWGGNGPGYVEMEFPIIPYLVALMEQWFGLSNLFVLLIPMLSAICAVVVTYLLGKYCYNESVGFIAGLVVAVCPTFSAWSQAFVGDPSVVLCTVFGLYAFLLWIDGKGRWYYLLSAVSLALAGLLKPVGLMVGVPLLVACYAKDGISLFKRPAYWLFAILVLTPVALWYYHAWWLGETYGNTFGVLTHGYLKYATKALLTNPVFYVRMVWRIMLYYVTPLMFIGLLAGLFTKPATPHHRIIYSWIVINVLYIIGFAEGNNQMVYYQLPILVPAAILSGAGIMTLWEKTGRMRSFRWLTTSPGRAGILLSIFFVISTIVGTIDYHTRADYRPEGRKLKEMGVRVGKQLHPGTYIIYTSGDVNNQQMQYSMTPPDIFYHSGHRGWYRALSWLTIPMIEDLRAQGAAYVISHRQEFLDQRPDIDTYLRQHYAVIYEKENTLIFDLNPRP